MLGNRSRPNIDAAVGRGATEVKSARELASQAEIVMLCVGTSDQVEGLIEGDDGVIAGLKLVASWWTLARHYLHPLESSVRPLRQRVASCSMHHWVAHRHMRLTDC